MKKESAIILAVIAFMAGGFIFAHRRVIKALINNEPIPKAPKWHFWVAEKGRLKK